MKPKVVIACVIIIALLGLSSMWRLQDSPVNAYPVPFQQTLPWQIEQLDGHVKVFGLTLGLSHIGDAVKIAGDDVEIAVLEASGKPAAVELFGSHFNTGNLTGSIEVMAQASPQEIAQLKDALSARSEMLETGVRKTVLRFEQQQRAFPLLIRSITFVPVAALDAALVERYFGPPGLQLATAAGVIEYFYPGKGVVVIVNERGRDFIQYAELQDLALLEQEARRKAGLYQQHQP